jgi:hypothetical protein
LSRGKISVTQDSVTAIVFSLVASTAYAQYNLIFGENKFLPGGYLVLKFYQVLEDKSSIIQTSYFAQTSYQRSEVKPEAATKGSVLSQEHTALLPVGQKFGRKV